MNVAGCSSPDAEAYAESSSLPVVTCGCTRGSPAHMWRRCQGNHFNLSQLAAASSCWLALAKQCGKVIKKMGHTLVNSIDRLTHY